MDEHVLAAVVRGDKPDSLLDSYTSERRPIADAVLANTLAQIAIMRDAMVDAFNKGDLDRLLSHTTPDVVVTDVQMSGDLGSIAPPGSLSVA